MVARDANVPAFGLPKNGFGTVCVKALPSGRYFGSTWLMLTLPLRLRRRPVDPIYATLPLRLPKSSRCTSIEYWCTYGAVLFGSTELTPDSRPRELPETGISPDGNGFTMLISGMTVGCAMVVVAE